MSVVFVRNPCLGWIEIFKNYLQNLSPVLSEVIKREMPICVKVMNLNWRQLWIWKRSLVNCTKAQAEAYQPYFS